MSIIEFIQRRVTQLRTEPAYLEVDLTWPLEVWRKELGTISINMGRRSGHTTIAKELGYPILTHSFRFNQVMFNNQAMVLDDKTTWGRNLDVVVVDAASMIKKTYKKKYKAFLRQYPKTIIIELG